MDICLKVIENKERGNGTIILSKKVGDNIVQVGNITFEDEKLGKWLLNALMEYNPNVKMC